MEYNTPDDTMYSTLITTITLKITVIFMQITRKDVDLRKHTEGPLLCQVKIGFERPSAENLNNIIRLDGIKPKRKFPIHIDASLLRRMSSDGKLNMYRKYF